MSSIGGNVAECAGGPRAFKYGTTKRYVLALEAVLPTGEIVRDRLEGGEERRRLRPDAAAGRIRRARWRSSRRITLRLIPKPPARATLLALFADIRGGGGRGVGADSAPRRARGARARRCRLAGGDPRAPPAGGRAGRYRRRADRRVRRHAGGGGRGDRSRRGRVPGGRRDARVARGQRRGSRSAVERAAPAVRRAEGDRAC